MKRYAIIAAVILITGSAFGALRVGLGNAVAKRSAELINKAGASQAPASGDNVASTLDACPAGAIYDSAPTDLGSVSRIDPLGHVQPSGHTLPSDHIYYYVSTSAVSTPNVYAPGKIHISQVTSSSNLSAHPPFTDYSITFFACQNVRSYYAHVRTLSASLQNQLGAFNQNCNTYSTGGSTFQSCSVYTNLVFESGDVLGTAPPVGALDFGSTDNRITPLAFASPARHYLFQPYTVCPVDYFTDSLKTQMDGMMGNAQSGYTRTLAPVCGQINFDIAGTARGDWYHPGSPDSPEDPHLALIVNNVYAPHQTISYGTSLPNFGPNWYIFVPTSSGLINRDFAQVTADGQIYCYDSLLDPIEQSIGGGTIFLIQMLSATSIKFERQSMTNCSSGPWAFTSHAVTFQR